jgi:hypothetical protein
MVWAAGAAAAADIRCHERGTCAYNGTFAKQLTYVNQATMCGEEAIRAWTPASIGEAATRGLALTDVVVVTNETMQVRAVVGHFGADQCVLSFRGSRTPYKYFVEIKNFPLEPYVSSPWCKGCEVEIGFHKIWRSLVDDVFSAVRRLCTGRALHITGHSLGAALAQLAFLETDFQIASLYAFASPRVGNAGFASAIRAKTSVVPRGEAWHIVHYKDAVPHIPPFHVLGYAHGLNSVSCMTEDNCANATYDFCEANDHKCGFETWPLYELYPPDHCHYLDTMICHCKGKHEQVAAHGSEAILV